MHACVCVCVFVFCAHVHVHLHGLYMYTCIYRYLIKYDACTNVACVFTHGCFLDVFFLLISRRGCVNVACMQDETSIHLTSHHAASYKMLSDYAYSLLVCT